MVVVVVVEFYTPAGNENGQICLPEKKKSMFVLSQ